MKPKLILAFAGTLFGVLACGDSTAPDKSFNQADANSIAVQLDALLVSSLIDAGASFSANFSISPSDASPRATTGPVNRAFSNTRPCPLGGTITVAGTSVGTSDPVAHDLAITTNATVTDAACAFNTQRGVLTLSGNPSVALTSSINVVAGKPVGPQVQTRKGSVLWSRAGNSGTCNIDLTSTYDPTAVTFRVVGVMCGHPVNVTRPALAIAN